MFRKVTCGRRKKEQRAQVFSVLFTILVRNPETVFRIVTCARREEKQRTQVLSVLVAYLGELSVGSGGGGGPEARPARGSGARGRTFRHGRLLGQLPRALQLAQRQRQLELVLGLRRHGQGLLLETLDNTITQLHFIWMVNHEKTTERTKVAYNFDLYIGNTEIQKILFELQNRHIRNKKQQNR